VIYHDLLETLGIEPKASKVYLALLKIGPSPVRKIAVESSINRGTTHQLLRLLITQGLVSFYHKSKRQYFVAEAPEKLLSLASQRIEKMKQAQSELERALPQLHQLSVKKGEATIVRSFEGRQGVRSVLEEVLDVMAHSPHKVYRVYSSSTLRESLYKSFPNFTQERITREIFVRVIAIGTGGEHQQLSERVWLPAREHASTYRLMYDDRIAVISLSKNNDLRAVVIQDPGFYQTEILLFDELWKRLSSS